LWPDSRQAIILRCPHEPVSEMDTPKKLDLTRPGDATVLFGPTRRLPGISIFFRLCMFGPFPFPIADMVDRWTNRLGATHRTSPWRGKAPAFLEDKVTVKTTRWLGYQVCTVTQGLFQVREMLVDLLFADSHDSRDVARRTLVLAEQMQNLPANGHTGCAGLVPHCD